MNPIASWSPHPIIPRTPPDAFTIALRAAWDRRCTDDLDVDKLRSKPHQADKAYREFAAGFAAGWGGEPMNSEWKPIETAPAGVVSTATINDGEATDVRDLRKNGRLWVKPDGSMHWTDRGGSFVYDAPTHWRAL